MKRSKVLGIGVGLCGGALALAMALGGASPSKSGGASGAPPGGEARAGGVSAGALARRGCDLHAGDRLAFALRSRSSNVMSAGKLLGPDRAPSALTAGPRETRTVEGDLLLRVLDAGEEGASPRKLTLAAVLDRPEVRVGGAPAAALEQDLSVPVLFEMDTECRLYGFAPSAPIGAAAANLWKGTLNMAEMVIAAPGTRPSWTVEQADTTGTFVASYERRDGEGGASTIRRSRGAFTALHDDARGAASASILRSTAAATYLPGAGFFRDLQVEEHVTLAMNGAPMADVEATMTLQGKDVAADTAGFWTRAFPGDLAFTPLDERTAAPPRLPYANRPPIEGLRDRPLPAILAEVGTFLAQKPQPDFDGALNLLVQSIRTDPARAAALLAEVRAGGAGADAASMIFLSLGLAGGKEATAALTSALQDPRLSEAHRLQALSALAGVPDPDAAVTDTLLQVREPRGAAVLALGALAHNPHLPAAERQRITAALDGELDAARSASEKISALGALGNAADPALRGRVASFTGSAEPGVAAAAYRALRKMDALPPAGELLESYSKAQDAPTREAIAAVLPAATLGASDVARAAGLLAEPQPPAARAALIRLLGAAAQRDAAAKAALVRQLRVETEPSLLSLIGRYLDASDLM